MEERKPLNEMIEEHNMNLSKKLTNYKGLAAMLGISDSKAKELMRRSDAPVLKIGSRKYIVIDRIDNWIDEMIKNNNLY